MKITSLIQCVILGAFGLLVSAAIPVQAQEVASATPPSRGRGPAAPVETVDGPTAAFAATVYELHMPVDQIGRLDVENLTRAAATPKEFEKALGALGTAHISYLVSQSVQLAQDSIRIGATTPYISNSQVTNNGDTINSITYRGIGAIFDVSGKVKTASQIDLNLTVHFSAITDAGIVISDKVTAPSFRTTQMARKGLVQPGKAFVLVSADGASPDSEGKAIAVVVRVTLGTPE